MYVAKLNQHERLIPQKGIRGVTRASDRKPLQKESPNVTPVNRNGALLGLQVTVVSLPFLVLLFLGRFPIPYCSMLILLLTASRGPRAVSGSADPCRLHAMYTSDKSRSRQCLFFCIPFVILVLLLRSLPVTTQIRGHI